MPKKSSKKLSSNKAPLKTKSGKVSQSKAQRSVVKPATESSKSLSDLKTQAGKVVKGLARTYADAVCALDHQTPFQLLAATILSAQCTDERVNMVTPELFRRWPDAGQLASASQSDVEEVVRSTGFFRAKAANLIGMAQGLVERYGGEVPRTIEELIVLPGVGRKTANVVLGTCFGIASGVVVDTHVKRIVNLLGLTTKSNPEQIEQELMELVPAKEWVNFSHRLIHHGRRICVARRPQCRDCPLFDCCDRVGLPDQLASVEAGH